MGGQLTWVMGLKGQELTVCFGLMELSVVSSSDIWVLCGVAELLLAFYVRCTRCV
jgi:hypothetical protein